MNVELDRKQPDARRTWALFFLALLWYGWFLTPLPNWNVNSRAGLTASIVLDHKVDLSRYFKSTGDLACVNGQYYSDKPPGLSWMAIPWLTVWSFRLVVEPADLWQIYLMTFFTVSVSAALLVVLLYRFLFRLTSGDDEVSLLITLAYALGTIAFPYATLLYAHQTVALILLILFILAYNVHHDKQGVSRVWISLAFGFLCGALFVTETQTALAAAAIGLYFLFGGMRSGMRSVVLSVILIAAGALLPLGCWFAYNKIIFHQLVDFGYHYECVPEIYKGMTRGFGGMAAPRLKTIYELFLMPGRGLFFVSPFLMLAIPGFWKMFAKREIRWEAAVCAWVCAITAAVSICVFQPGGGAAIGPRYMLPMLPFFAIPAALFLSGLKRNAASSRMSKRELFIAVAGGTAIISAAQMLIGTMTNPQVPRGILVPLGQYTLPMLLDGYIRPGILSFLGDNAWLHILPPAMISLLLLASLMKRDTSSAMPKADAKKRSKSTSIFLLTMIVFGVITATGNLVIARRERQVSYSAIADSYRFLGKNALARKYYEATLRQAPHSAPAHFGLGLLEYQDKQPFDALYHFEQAVQWNSQFSEAYFNLGYLYKNMGRDEDAAKVFLKSVETDMDNSLYRNATALELAEEEARRVLTVDPSNTEVKDILKKIRARKK